MGRRTPRGIPPEMFFGGFMERLFFWTGLIMFAIVLLGVAAGVAQAIRENLTRRRRFIETFVSQQVVDVRLLSFAQELKGAFDDQVELQVRMREKDISIREQSSNTVTRRITDAKERFWNQVKLASDLGFKVPKTIDEALLLGEPSQSTDDISLPREVAMR